MSYDFLCINVMIFFVFPLQIINRLLVLLPFPVQNFLYFLLRLCFYLLQFFLCLFFQVPVKLIPFFLYLFFNFTFLLSGMLYDRLAVSSTSANFSITEFISRPPFCTFHNE